MRAFLLCLNIFCVLLTAPAQVSLSPGQEHGDTSSAGSAPDTVRGAPVVFADDTLFFLVRPLGAFTAAERAEAIGRRLSRFSSDPLASVDSIFAVETEGGTEIVSGENTLMVVSDADARAEGRGRRELAADYRNRIHAALVRGHESSSLSAILQGALFAILATVALVVLFKFLNRVFPRLYLRIDSAKTTKIPSIRIQKLELLSAERITALILLAMKAGRVALGITLFYFYIPLLFSFFPWTRGFAAKLFGFIMTPVAAVWDSFVSFLPNVFFIGVIILVTRYVILFVRWIASEVERGTITLPGFFPEWAKPTYKLLRFIVIIFSVVVIFPYLPGSGSPAFQGVGVFLGLLLSLGSASAISNIIAGVVLIYMRAFSIGDRVRIADTFGDVVEKSLLVTRIRTVKNVDVTVPNALVLGTHLVNFSSASEGKRLILHTTVTIGYDAPWQKVHELLISAAESTDHVLREPKPFVLQTALSDFYVNYEINAFTDDPHVMSKTYSDLHARIQDAFNEAGVEIMSAHYTSVRDGNRTTVPDQYLPESYTPPPFRILPGIEFPGRKGGNPSSEKTQ